MVVFRQVLYRDLGCASYVVGDGGLAVVVDPRWDIDVYLEIAREEQLRIAHILDTHDHADHVSGRRRLARMTGARSYHAVVDGDDAEDGIRPGEEIAVGAVRVRAVPTPGHRPEHLVFAVTDLSRGSDAWMLLTGDSLLVGDLARPDLAVDAHEGASLLHASVGSLLALGDHVEVWPGHVGGSLCGGAGLSGKTSSTVGYERLHNPLLAAGHNEFVRGLTEGIPPRPPNIERIVEINRAGAVEPEPVLELSAERLRDELTPGVSVLDPRTPKRSTRATSPAPSTCRSAPAAPGPGPAGHSRPARRSSSPPTLHETAHQMVLALQAVGLWHIIGYVVGSGETWMRDGLPVTTAESWDLSRLAGGLRRDEVALVDVRDTAEWVAGHVPGSRHMPLHHLRAGAQLPLPRDGRTTAVACAAGNRAAFAASLLRRASHANVVRISGGGIADLHRHGIDLDIGA